MARKDISLRKWQANYANGLYDSPDRQTMCAAGWYDWFCKDESLKRRLDKMAKIVMQLQESKRVRPDTMYVWFKNNCPMSGPTYDDFRLANMFNGDTEYTITIDCEYERDRYDAKYVVYGKENDFKGPLFTCKDARELVAWFNAK